MNSLIFSDFAMWPFTQKVCFDGKRFGFHKVKKIPVRKKFAQGMHGIPS